MSGQGADGLCEQRRQEFHCLQRLLVPEKFVIPFSEKLADLFPKEPLEVRRAFGHVTSMIQASALLHQYQRQRDSEGRIVAQPEDYWLAHHLLKDVLGRSLGHKSADALRRFVVRLKKYTGEQTAKELAQAMNISERTVREHLHALLEQGAIEQTEPARGPIPAKWMVREDIELRDPESNATPLGACGLWSG